MKMLYTCKIKKFALLAVSIIVSGSICQGAFTIAMADASTTANITFDGPVGSSVTMNSNSSLSWSGFITGASEQYTYALGVFNLIIDTNSVTLATAPFGVGLSFFGTTEVQSYSFFAPPSIPGFPVLGPQNFVFNDPSSPVIPSMTGTVTPSGAANINLVPEAHTYAGLFGFIALFYVYLRRQYWQRLKSNKTA
jgi:hypothetical protein